MHVFVNNQNPNCYENCMLINAFRNHLQNKISLELKYFYIHLNDMQLP